MIEQVANLHMHTIYSDGFGTHNAIAEAASSVGIDIVIITDHNVFVDGLEGYYGEDDNRVMLLMGEEIHDQTRQPQKNHMLALGANRDLAPYGYDPQILIDRVNQAEGLTFIAHPVDPAAPAVGESDLSWVDWQVEGFTGIELWNAMSEFKSRLKTKLHALYYVFNPRQIAHGPLPQALQIWDDLLAKGRRTVAIGGTDAHAFNMRWGPVRRIVFPYEFHFRTVNTHLFTPQELTGDIETDRRMVFSSLAQGHAFIGYDLPAPTRGFRFTAQGKDEVAWMGDNVSSEYGITFQIRLPEAVECHLLKDGKVIKQWANREVCTHITSEPGVYRAEAYIHYLGRRRGWIFSNPIYAY